MDRAENDLFRRAIVEALSQNNREELAECTDPVVCSKQHYRKMSAILGFRVRKPIVWTRTRKMWVAAIIAAALLLTGCAVANYKAIGEFLVNFYEDHIKMTDNSEEGLNHDGFEMYELTYVPEGYDLVETVVGDTTYHYKWRNETGDKTLAFNQSERGSYIHTFDEDAELIEVGDSRVLVSSVRNGYLYAWCVDQYAFTLRSNCALDIEELQKIIEGVSLVPTN